MASIPPFGYPRSICDEGDSLTEPYIAGHNVLNAHAKVVSTYRTKYKRDQGGVIGITLNCDWAMVRERERLARDVRYGVARIFCSKRTGYLCIISSIVR